MSEGFAAYCRTCQAYDDCRVVFGRFWPEKSHGGVGCRAPLRRTKSVAARNAPRRCTEQHFIF